MFAIDHNSPVPLYEQVRTQILALRMRRTEDNGKTAALRHKAQINLFMGSEELLLQETHGDPWRMLYVVCTGDDGSPMVTTRFLPD